ncbi:hypothetical protein ACA910_016233 [Epithemia clementina (nom. ined.)]
MGRSQSFLWRLAFLVGLFLRSLERCSAWSSPASSSCPTKLSTPRTRRRTPPPPRKVVVSSTTAANGQTVQDQRQSFPKPTTESTGSSLSVVVGRRAMMHIWWVGSGVATSWTMPQGDGRPNIAWALFGDDDVAAAATAAATEIVTVPQGDVKRFYNEARALESQGNIAAAQRLYNRITEIEPRFIYGWSQLGNTQTALGDLPSAMQSYSTAIDLCLENNRYVEAALAAGGAGGRKCTDLYVLLLNRGSIRLNTGEPVLALEDLTQANALRGRPDAVILQNLARAKELNGQYASADRDYTTAILMTSNAVSPFWLRSAMVKLELGDGTSALDILKRVENKFPQAPEVRAAYAVLLSAVKDDFVAAKQKYLEIPDRARLKYTDDTYLTQTIAWPPAMRREVTKIARAVGDLPARR